MLHVIGVAIFLACLATVGLISYGLGVALANRAETVNTQKRLVEARHWRARDPILDRNLQSTHKKTPTLYAVNNAKAK
jgi:sulfite exporter TauE/SafE